MSDINLKSNSPKRRGWLRKLVWLAGICTNPGEFCIQ